VAPTVGTRVARTDDCLPGRREATMIATANCVGLPLMFLSSILIGSS
jgi:hypothetical protein